MDVESLACSALFTASAAIGDRGLSQPSPVFAPVVPRRNLPLPVVAHPPCLPAFPPNGKGPVAQTVPTQPRGHDPTTQAQVYLIGFAAPRFRYSSGTRFPTYSRC